MVPGILNGDNRSTKERFIENTKRAAPGNGGGLFFCPGFGLRGTFYLNRCLIYRHRNSADNNRSFAGIRYEIMGIRYLVKPAGGEFYRLMEKQEKRMKNGKLWKTVAIGTKRLYELAERLNSRR